MSHTPRTTTTDLITENAALRQELLETRNRVKELNQALIELGGISASWANKATRSEFELATLKQGQGDAVGIWEGCGITHFNPGRRISNGTVLYTSAPTVPAVTKPERDDYCGSCGEWLGGPVICCHHLDEKPAITKTEAKALRAMLSAAPKLGETK